MIRETVASLAELVGGSVIGDATRAIVGVCDLRHAAADRIGFVRDSHYRDAAKETAAGALITAERLDTKAAQIVVTDVGVAFARVARRFNPAPAAEAHRIHPSAIVDPEARLQEPVEIGPHAAVGKAQVGAGTVLMAGASIADGCSVGRDCVLFPNVTLYPGTVLGDRVLVHSGAVIGSDGFGYVKDDGRWLKVPQLGNVVLEDDVEIGANCTIDRGAIGDTRIGEGVKLDNLCHIGHNCHIGRHSALAAGCILGGSTILGERVTFGGHVLSGGHLRVGDDVRVGGNSGLLRDTLQPGDYMGYPVMDKARFFRHMAALRELVDLAKTVEHLEDEETGSSGS